MELCAVEMGIIIIIIIIIVIFRKDHSSVFRGFFKMSPVWFSIAALLLNAHNCEISFIVTK